ncbi:MAG: lipocalin family protein [Rikenellaceae bacterium]
MKTKLSVTLALALFFAFFLTSSTPDYNKQLVGKWCNPYTYESSGEIKGFHFKKGGKCESINIPTLDLKTWEVTDGKLIITGFYIDENGVRSEYRTEERIENITKDELIVIAKEKDPKLVFRYVPVKKVKKLTQSKE